MYKLKDSKNNFVHFKEGYSYMGNIQKNQVNLKRVAVMNPKSSVFNASQSDQEFLNRLKEIKSTNNNEIYSVNKNEMEEENVENKEIEENVNVEDKKEFLQGFGEINGITSNKKLKK